MVSSENMTPCFVSLKLSVKNAKRALKSLAHENLYEILHSVCGNYYVCSVQGGKVS